MNATAAITVSFFEKGVVAGALLLSKQLLRSDCDGPGKAVTAAGLLEYAHDQEKADESEKTTATILSFNGLSTIFVNSFSVLIVSQKISTCNSRVLIFPNRLASSRGPCYHLL